MKTIAGFLLVLGACTPFAPDLDDTPYLCGDSEPRCPDGYGCQTDGLTGEEICVGNDDSLSQDFNCADDSANEPNNGLEEATALAVPRLQRPPSFVEVEGRVAEAHHVQQERH